MLHIEVTHKKILVDDTPIIRISNLTSAQNVTLIAHMYEANQGFMAYAHYTANSDGVVSNISSNSVGGYFTGKLTIYYKQV